MAPSNESVPTEMSRLMNGPRPSATKPTTAICKWIFCAALGWGLIGAITFLIGSELLGQSKWRAPMYAIANLAYFTSFVPPPMPNETSVSAAFVGNGMMFYNNLPRLMEALSEGQVTQNSCFR
jgi:uncharacterized membrane protein YuzA (DUF378 family)